ncbi:MAG: glutathione synthase [Aquimonas sp.]|nr:glutathione synthase [Aquimonas sp.]
MSIELAVVMDSIAHINIRKDSTFAMLLEGQRRGWQLYYATTGDLALESGMAMARLSALRVRDDPAGWFELGTPGWRPLGELDFALMRRDPPVDAQYLYDTHVLALAQRQGCRVVNDPQGLRDMNEKLYALHFPHCCPPSRVSRDPAHLREFVMQYQDCVLKPLDGMGGRSIFRARAGEDNLKVILETLTAGGQQMALAQRYLPEIRDGDKRILLVDGEPVPYALARIPPADDFRGNLAAGGRGEGRPLTDRDRWIAAEVGPELRARGMRFVGLDVIGDWLTEINVTSPTCIRELDAQFQLNIAGSFFDALEASLT